LKLLRENIFCFKEPRKKVESTKRENDMKEAQEKKLSKGPE
jgi:hypothetical protein